MAVIILALLGHLLYAKNSIRSQCPMGASNLILRTMLRGCRLHNHFAKEEMQAKQIKFFTKAHNILFRPSRLQSLCLTETRLLTHGVQKPMSLYCLQLADRETQPAALLEFKAKLFLLYQPTSLISPTLEIILLLKDVYIMFFHSPFVYFVLFTPTEESAMISSCGTLHELLLCDPGSS